MKLTNEDVQDILQLLDATNFDELRLETGRFKLTLKRIPGNARWTQEMQHIATPILIEREPASPAKPASVSPANSADTLQSTWPAIRAHLPGTFYRAPRPGAPPFVEIGSRVENGTVVGIVETMKLMNAVHAEACGEIAEISCEYARFAEKGTGLMRINPSSP